MTKIGFIGSGQMARALARGFVAAGKVAASDVRACDPSLAALHALQTEVPGAVLAETPNECATDSDIVFIAVKPQHIGSVFDQLSWQHKCLFVSIAAGVPVKQLCSGIGSDRVVRVMPNTPCLVGAGAAGYCMADGVAKADGELVGELLGSVGVAFELPESQLDAVTGLSGSGPAFVYQIIEAMSDGGVRVGLPRNVATQLAAQTVLGAAKMVLETQEHPGVLKDNVASPGGTTIAGLHALESGGLRGTLIDAIKAATDRSQELGGG